MFFHVFSSVSVSMVFSWISIDFDGVPTGSWAASEEPHAVDDAALRGGRGAGQLEPRGRAGGAGAGAGGPDLLLGDLRSAVSRAFAVSGWQGLGRFEERANPVRIRAGLGLEPFSGYFKHF